MFLSFNNWKEFGEYWTLKKEKDEGHGALQISSTLHTIFALCVKCNKDTKKKKRLLERKLGIPSGKTEAGLWLLIL